MKSVALISSVCILILPVAGPTWAQRPGTPLAGFTAPGSPRNMITEPAAIGPPGALETRVLTDPGATIKDGLLIILNTHVDPRDPSIWRDVAAFSN